MSRVSKQELLERILDAIRHSGYQPIVLSDVHPFIIVFSSGEYSQRIRCYIWNLTHGGFPRNPNEQRIQTTGIDRFLVTQNCKTLVLGWSEDLQVFAGFDVTKHTIAMGGRSPSHQILLQTLENANRDGISTQRRGNDEIAIGIRPDLFSAYVEQLEGLHGSAQVADETTLVTIANRPVDEDIVDIPPSPRQTIMQQIQRKVRDSKFRTNLLRAYQNRCAISGMQLDLLDAAHIIPVEDDRGTDETKNGICMTPLHHRAFDSGLLGIRTDYSIIINTNKVASLRHLGWDGGLDTFRATLRDQLLLPARRNLYPDPDYLVTGQLLRKWPERNIRV